jgi:hypothetical protein
MSNDEEAFINGFNQLSKSMIDIPGANQLILEQIQKHILEKYPDMQDKLSLIKDKLQELQEKVLSRNSEISDNIGENSNELSNLITKSLVRDDPLEVTMPVMGVVKNRSERRVAELDRGVIKVVPHNSWHYSTLNNYNDSNLPEPIVKKNITRIMRDNEMQLRDPSRQYRNFSRWKEKVKHD